VFPLPRRSASVDAQIGAPIVAFHENAERGRHGRAMAYAERQVLALDPNGNEGLSDISGETRPSLATRFIASRQPSMVK
jgi:hypothetical protein